MIKEITLNGRLVKYELERKNVKNINLRIKPNRMLYISANDSVSDQYITEFIVSKTDFIIKALEHYDELARYAPKPKEYVDGETITMFGHGLRLKASEGKKNSVKSDYSYVYLTVKDITDYELKKKTVEKWIKKEFVYKVTDICKSVYPMFEKYNIEFPEIRVRNMVSRWGSCQPKRKIITFSIPLHEAPVGCIEYVAVHEFTHFLHPNHSKAFYNQLDVFMPDWRQRKAILEKTNSFSE